MKLSLTRQKRSCVFSFNQQQNQNNGSHEFASIFRVFVCSDYSYYSYMSLFFLSRTFHSFLYHATRSEKCLLCNNDSLTTINSFLQKHSEANYRCFCCLLQQNEEINQSACDLAKGVAQEGGVFSAGSICQTARLYAQGAGKERIQKRFEAQIAIFLKNDLDLLIAEVSKKQCR